MAKSKDDGRVPKILSRNLSASFAAHILTILLSNHPRIFHWLTHQNTGQQSSRLGFYGSQNKRSGIGFGMWQPVNGFGGVFNGRGSMSEMIAKHTLTADYELAAPPPTISTNFEDLMFTARFTFSAPGFNGVKSCFVVFVPPDLKYEH